jgi:hypothetical protein
MYPGAATRPDIAFANAIILTKNPVYHKMSKNIEVRQLDVRERYLHDDIRIEHTDGRKQLAYLLTKPTELVAFEILCHEIRIGSGEH